MFLGSLLLGLLLGLIIVSFVLLLPIILFNSLVDLGCALCKKEN